ncbi:DUF3616 domain-containing protein [Paracoccus sp. T5]|uniref:DUF3616 domain-containing protein n=1 Tax=Paracoccus sp. T5 TaxID=3402161 RepID=UPI003AE5E560
MDEAPNRQVLLIFGEIDELKHVDDPLHKDVSAAARVGDALFTCCDETAGVDRLTPDGDAWGNHVHISIGDFICLPGGPGGEMDIEGLMADMGWLWVIGSHALKRGKAKGGRKAALRRLSKIERDPNRMFLGRIPLAERDGAPMPVAKDGARRVQTVRLGANKSQLRKWLRNDEHIGPFLELPCKENGLDIEGIAVRGMRVWLGLRGPVLREMAAVLEFEFKVTRSGYLKARRIDGTRRYRKHLIPTRGLGIRDLELDGDDLILLTAPVTAADGVAAIRRWCGAVSVTSSGVVPEADVAVVRDLPYRGQHDHPEGLVRWDDGEWLVVYDSPAPERLDSKPARLLADIWSE